jgi:hypothetical protein
VTIADFTNGYLPVETGQIIVAEFDGVGRARAKFVD